MEKTTWCVIPEWFYRADSIQFSYQIQYECYGGNRSVSIEGIALHHFSASNQANSSLTSEAVSRQEFCCSFLSNDIKQDVETTDAHSKYIMELLHSRNLFMTKQYIPDNKYGCAEKYIYTTALYLLSMLSHWYNTLIDRGVGAPGNDKYVVDGLNVTNKRFLTMMIDMSVISWCIH